MRKILLIIYYWLPPLLWMGVIFYMSSQKSIATGGNLAADFITFKTLHVVEYAFLFLLLYRAINSISYMNSALYSVFSFSVAMLYSITDELHQLTIPSRSGRFMDVLFDLTGMIIMYGIIKKIRLIKKLL